MRRRHGEQGIARAAVAELLRLLALGLARVVFIERFVDLAVEAQEIAEPVVRVTVEADDDALVKSTLETLADAVRAAAAA